MTDAIDLESEYALTLLYSEDITADAARWKELRAWLESQDCRVTWQQTRIPVARARYQLDIEPVLGAKVDVVSFMIAGWSFNSLLRETSSEPAAPGRA